MSVPLAHLGHWYGEIAFAVPLLVLVALAGWDRLKRRGRGGRGRRGG